MEELPVANECSEGLLVVVPIDESIRIWNI